MPYDTEMDPLHLYIQKCHSADPRQLEPPRARRATRRGRRAGEDAQPVARPAMRGWMNEGKSYVPPVASAK